MELTIYALLGDVEVLDVEEAFVADRIDKGFGELFLAFRGVKQTEVDCNKLSPVKVFLW